MNEDLWFGSPESLFEYLADRKRARESMTELRSNDDDEEPENPVGYEIVANGIAVLTIRGSTLSDTTWWSRYLGYVSYDDIRERVIQAADDPAVKCIVPKISSSGGAANKVKPLAKFMRLINDRVKPIFGYTDSMMASAALWYGTAGKGVFAGEDARVGSLGAIMTHFEVTEQLKMEGVKATVFRTAPYKALGGPYEVLSEKATKEIEREMQELHDSFVAGIALNRNLAPAYVGSDIATGRVFNAEKALDLKLIDGVISFEDTIARLARTIDNRARQR